MAHFILFAEDDKDDAAIITLACEQAGLPRHDFHILKNGLEVVAWLNECKLPASTHRTPTMIITDLRMIKMDGFQLLAWIRSCKDYDNLPVIILTAAASIPNRELAELLDCSGLFEKPADFDRWVSLISMLLQQTVSTLPALAENKLRPFNR